MAFPQIHQITSPTSIGRTPGCLFNAIKRLARKSEEYLRKEDNSCFHLAASIPEGPEEQSDFSADQRIKSPIKESNKIECKPSGDIEEETMADG